MWLMEFKLAAGAAGVGEGLAELPPIPWQPARHSIVRTIQHRNGAIGLRFELVFLDLGT
jgi:hypothetical protein